MNAFPRFDPWVVLAESSETTAKPAKTAKGGGQRSSFSGISNFSGGTRPNVVLGETNDAKPNLFWCADDWRTDFDERAGICQYAGGLTRAEAENIALDGVIVRWISENPPTTEPDRCAGCGESVDETDRKIVLILGGRQDAWVHHRCHGDLMADQRQRAIEALTSMGIFPPSEGAT